MTDLSTTRRLAAILSADVVGYSRLMGADEEGTLAEIQRLRRELIDPMLAEHEGRMVKTTGDGALVEFPSVVNAVRFAITFQRAMVERNEEMERDKRIEFRIGVHLGDIIFDEGDVFGDGVNIAARLESIATPRGVRLSRAAYDQIEGKIDVAFHPLGPQALKNIARPVEVYAFDFAEKLAETQHAALNQAISYCRTPEGVRIAYATVGKGPPLFKTGNWLSHLQYEWESPIWRHLLRGLASRHTLYRYDARGQGLSDWDVDEISYEAWVRDLETVVDATGVERFPLLGMSQGCAISIAYAVRHPEKVSHLILYGGYATGWNRPPRAEKEAEASKAMTTLMRLGWGKPESTFRQMFTSMFIPDGTREQSDWFNELQRRTTSPECAARFMEAIGNTDVSDLLGQVTVPTLVMHVRGDGRVPFEAGRKMAAGIPGARFVALEGNNHIMLEGDPGVQRFLEEIEFFVAQ